MILSEAIRGGAGDEPAPAARGPMEGAPGARGAVQAAGPAAMLAQGVRDGEEVRFPNESSRVRPDDFDDLLAWAASRGASDVSAQTGEPVWIEVHGRLFQATRRRLDQAELVDIINQIYGANGSAELAKGGDIDVSYEVRIDRSSRLRFRVNGTAILSGGRDGIQITLRVLPDMPARLDQMNVEPGILAACSPRNGMVLMTGPTGSGKTTLLGAIIRAKLEDLANHIKLLTYEAPIELTYDKVRGARSFVAQTEIPRHLPSFAAGVRNALRRKPTDILIGECRDCATIEAACEASNTGHVLYSTTHANGVAETIRRLIAVFPGSERQSRAIDIVESLRLVVTQALLPTVDGRRVAAREFLAFDDDVRDRLLAAEPDGWPAVTRELVRERGQSMAAAVTRLWEEGRIARDVFERYAARARAAERAAAAPIGPEVLAGMIPA
jgi:defect-in-organelle-trafficking protein DotB